MADSHIAAGEPTGLRIAVWPRAHRPLRSHRKPLGNSSLKPDGVLLLAVVLVAVSLGAMPRAALAQDGGSLVIHVKTALSVDDAQICAVPNVAWAALSQGKSVTLFFDASAVTSVTKGFGWRGWVGMESTAMERAALPERERKSLADQFQVALDSVPRDYGEYLRFLKAKGADLYYNGTMAVLYNIGPEQVDPIVRPLGLKDMTELLTSADAILVY